MRVRLLAAAASGAVVWAAPAVAAAQDQQVGEPNLNWIFWLAVIVVAGFVLFLGFAVVYYLLAVVARNRRYAGEAAAVAVAATTGAGPRQAAPPAPAAQQAAPAAPPQAPAQQAPAQPAPAEPAAPPAAPPAEEKPAAEAAPAAAPVGGVPRVDPMSLPDGIDAVTRGRLKKLAILQERGQVPPQDLIEGLKEILEEMAGGPIDVDAASTGGSRPSEAGGASEGAAAPEAPAAEAPAAEAPAAEAPAAEAPPAEAAPAEAEAAPAEAAPAEAAPAEAAPAEPAPAEPEAPEEAPAEEKAQEPADTGGLPRVDPNNLPDGIDAVARGRLKKLAIFQERGKQPPEDLVESLRPILDQLEGS